MPCYCKCPVTLPHGAVGRSAVCDCGTMYFLIILTFCLYYYLFCFVRSLFSIHMRLYIAMFISYYVYIECRGRVETNVVSHCCKYFDNKICLNYSLELKKRQK